MKRVKRLRGYTDVARWLNEVGPAYREINHVPELHAAYSHSPTHEVHMYRGIPVVMVETGQRQFDIIDVTSLV